MATTISLQIQTVMEPISATVYIFKSKTIENEQIRKIDAMIWFHKKMRTITTEIIFNRKTIFRDVTSIELLKYAITKMSFHLLISKNPCTSLQFIEIRHFEYTIFYRILNCKISCLSDTFAFETKTKEKTTCENIFK